MVLIPDDDTAPRLPLERVRDIFAELAWHGDSQRLFARTGADEGELAEASRIVVLVLESLANTMPPGGGAA